MCEGRSAQQSKAGGGYAQNYVREHATHLDHLLSREWQRNSCSVGAPNTPVEVRGQSIHFPVHEGSSVEDSVTTVTHMIVQRNCHQRRVSNYTLEKRGVSAPQRKYIQVVDMWARGVQGVVSQVSTLSPLTKSRQDLVSIERHARIGHLRHPGPCRLTKGVKI